MTQTPARQTLWAACLALACAGFIALGTWQLERLSWKEALVARVDARVAAAAVPAPGPDAWPHFSASSSEYRKVTVTGTYLPGRDTLTQAVTERGPGFWLLTPLVTRQGFTVLINRGFIPQAIRNSPPEPPVGQRTVSGLLRITEPGGGFLRSNDPAADRWYSRDVSAIARVRRLSETAPYFIDAAAGQERPGGPVGGLTVIRFRNSHLSYALTWFALAAMAAYACWRFMRGPGEGRRGG